MENARPRDRHAAGLKLRKKNKGVSRLVRKAELLRIKPVKHAAAYKCTQSPCRSPSNCVQHSHGGPLEDRQCWSCWHVSVFVASHSQAEELAETRNASTSMLRGRKRKPLVISESLYVAAVFVFSMAENKGAARILM